MRVPRRPQTRLLLVDADDLRELWDALLPHEAGLAVDPGDFSFEVTRRLRERVGELLADAYDTGISESQPDPK